MSLSPKTTFALGLGIGDQAAARELETAINNAINGVLPTSLTIGSTTITEAEIGVVDGVTAGTVLASKAVVVDTNKAVDILGITTNRNLTAGASTAAAGSTTTDAGALPAGTAPVYPTTAADDATGVRISATDKVTGRLLMIGNGVSNKLLKVYAPSGGTINGGSADAAFSSVSGKGVIAYCLSSTSNTWLAW